MAATPPALWTMQQFRQATGSTGLFGKGRGLLAIIDVHLAAWNGGNCVGHRKKNLTRILRACHQWLQAKQGKTTALAVQRANAVNTLAQQAFARLQYEHFETHKRTQPNHPLRSLQGGYAHERATYVQSNKTMAYSGSTVSALIHNAPSIGLVNPPAFNNMTTQEFMQLINTYAGDQMLEPEVHFFTKQERIERLVVVMHGRLYTGPQQRLDTGGQDWAFVMDGYGNLYTTDHQMEQQQLPNGQRFNHSTLNAGKDVVCAGILQAANGRLTYLDNASGHYKPTRANVVEMLTTLQADGYDFTRRACRVRVMEVVAAQLQWSGFNDARTLIANPNANPDFVQ
jgi:hypothetical protein